MAEIIVRVYSKSGRSRITLPSTSTLKGLKDAITEHLLVPQDQMILTYESGKRIQGGPNTLLKAIEIVNGTIIKLENEANIPIPESGPPLGPMPLPDLVPQKSTEESEQQTKDQFIRRCTHVSGTRCINCFANEKKPENEEEKKKPEDNKWMCRHGPEGKCVNCLTDNFVSGIKHESFDHFMAARMAKCQHARDARCANCLPPAEMNYKVKQCNKHAPWPASICNSCMPSTAVLARQSYRHVDYVELMNVKEVTEFVRYWQQSHSLEQRGGFLYGYYAEDPNYPDGVRAVLESIYEPMQHGDMNGFQFLDDPYAIYADMIASELGLEKIGWIFTSINHDAFLSSFEIRQAGKYQEEYFTVHPSGYKVSKFVTVVLKPTDDGNAMPEAYMVSDQAQALERDNVFGESENRRRLAKRKPNDKELLPTIMCENKPSEEFQPEWFIVSVGCGMPKQSMTILEHSDFPVWNRQKNPSKVEIKQYLTKHRAEPGFKKFSNFHLLVAIANLVDIDTACEIARRVINQQEIPRDILDLLN